MTTIVDSNAAISPIESSAPRGPRRVDPATCDKFYDSDESEFLAALDRYKRENSRPFPTEAERFAILRDLGYAKRDPEEAVVALVYFN